MKANKAKFLFIIIFSLIFWNGCLSPYENETEIDIQNEPEKFAEESGQPEEQQTEIEPSEEETDETVIVDIPLSIEQAAEYISKLTEIWDADNGKLWGKNLHVPIVIFCHNTHEIVTNAPDNEGLLSPVETEFGIVYTGIWTGTRAGNWIFYWNETWWGMSVWQNMLEWGALETMAHEAFHVFQKNEWFITDVKRLKHISQNKDGEVESILGEVQALYRAWKSTGDERIEAINEALSIRKLRHEKLEEDPLGQVYISFEIYNEIQEGMATYTQFNLTMREGDKIDEWYNENIGYIESGIYPDWFFGYTSGSLYALLLDELGASWKEGITTETHLAALLEEFLFNLQYVQ